MKKRSASCEKQEIEFTLVLGDIISGHSQVVWKSVFGKSHYVPNTSYQCTLTHENSFKLKMHATYTFDIDPSLYEKNKHRTTCTCNVYGIGYSNQTVQFSKSGQYEVYSMMIDDDPTRSKIAYW